jgi:putative ABC transport system ATP-binding protein
VAVDALKSLYVEPEADAQRIDWPALEFRDVFKIYRSGPVETVALRGLSIEVQTGEIVGILGPSGCGKSTLLALAAALDQPSAGDVRVAGQSLARLDEVELAEFRSRKLAIVFQSDNLWPTLSARENVELALRLAGSTDSRDRADEALREFGLEKRMRNRPSALSGGEQQRVAIAAAAARNAELLLADEPTGELDAVNEATVLHALHRLRERYGTTVVVVTHSARVAQTVDRVIELKDGAVVSDAGAAAA